MSHRILAINPGSTSTKVAVYDEGEPVFNISLAHTPSDLERFPSVMDQFAWRKGLVESALSEAGISLKTIDAVIGRGGIIGPVESGVYEVNPDMVYDLHHAKMQHASNLGALFARESNTKYEDLNLIVCHMGGGITVSAHRHGKVIDTTNALDGCGPFSPERSGSLPPGPLVHLCFSGKYTEAELMRMVHGNGGLKAHLNTTSVPEVLDRIDHGDLHAMLVLRAMCYTVAKEIGEMAVSLKGKVDAILITGGMAHSKRITDFVAEHVSFIANIYVYPGENELKSLAENALAAIKGEREIKVYHHVDYDDPSQINDTRRPSKLREWLRAALPVAGSPAPLTAIRQYIRRWSSQK